MNESERNNVKNVENKEDEINKLKSENRKLKEELEKKKHRKYEFEIRSKRLQVLITPMLYDEIQAQIFNEANAAGCKNESVNEFINRAIKDELLLRAGMYLNWSDLEIEMIKLSMEADEVIENEHYQEIVQMDAYELEHASDSDREQFISIESLYNRALGKKETVKTLEKIIDSEKGKLSL